MTPDERIQEDLGEELAKKIFGWRTEPLEPVVALSPFRTAKTYQIDGPTGIFDFACLPSGSYCLYSVDETKAVRLTRNGKEIENVLAEHWDELPNCDAEVIASLVLQFFPDDRVDEHVVVRDADEVAHFGALHPHCGKGYVLDEKKWETLRERIGVTSSLRFDDTFIVRAVTLAGWKHEKQNLGVEYIHISRSGHVELEKRLVFAEKIFKKMPELRY